MPYEEVSEPISGQEAFSRFDSAAVQSQAAFLLLLGIQAESDSEEAKERQLSDILPEEDRKQIPIPPLLRTPRERFTGEEIRAALISRYPQLPAVSRGRFFGKERSAGEQGHSVGEPMQILPPSSTAFLYRNQEEIPDDYRREVLSEILPDLIDNIYTEPTWLAAARLTESCLFHQDPLVRVAAAASHIEFSSEWERPIGILEQGTHEQDSIVRDVAATVLARIVPNHPRLVELTAPVLVGKSGEPSHTSLLVHGTWARSSSWWQPGGDFHTYLLNSVRDDLYGDNDVFSWSGLYNDSARQLGAQDLINWVEGHDMDGLNHLFAHSHGGSVAMLASKGGLDIKKLVLLSCPVHSQYMPDFNRVGKVISIRVHCDLVILADRGGQKYRHPEIHERVLPIWFKHSTTHDPDVWQRHNIPELL